MKAFFLVFVVCALCSVAGAVTPEGKYNVVKYTSTDHWPIGWNRVDLNKLTDVTIVKVQDIFYLTLTDAAGVSWSSNFFICSRQISECNAQYSDDKTILAIDFGDVYYSLKLIILENEKEIILSVRGGTQFAYITFDYKKN